MDFNSFRVFIPAGLSEVNQKAELFNSDDARNLVTTEPRTKFGFEVKTKYTDISYLPGFSTEYPFGIHFPNDFANRWLSRDPQARRLAAAIAQLCKKATNPPLYAVLHGNKVEAQRTYQPTDPNRFLYLGSIRDYTNAFDKLVGLIRELQQKGIPVAVENTSLSNQFLDDGKYVPPTHLELRIGTLAKDVASLFKRTNCLRVVDVEHLVFTVNFLRKHGCVNSDLGEMSFSELMVQPGSPIGISRLPDVRQEMSGVAPNVVHIVGNGFNTTELVEEDGQLVIAEHSPIRRDDPQTKELLKFILGHGLFNTGLNLLAPTLVVESSGPAPFYTKDRPDNTLESSFNNLCLLCTQLFWDF